MKNKRKIVLNIVKSSVEILFVSNENKLLKVRNE